MNYLQLSYNLIIHKPLIILKTIKHIQKLHKIQNKD